MLESWAFALPPIPHAMALALMNEPSLRIQLVKSAVFGVVFQLPTSTPRPVADEAQPETGGIALYVAVRRTTETLARSRACDVPKVKPLLAEAANAPADSGSWRAMRIPLSKVRAASRFMPFGSLATKRYILIGWFSLIWVYYYKCAHRPKRLLIRCNTGWAAGMIGAT